MDIARTRRRVEDEVIQVAPVCIAYQLLQRVAGHRPTPQSGLVGIDKETDRQHLDAVTLHRHNQITAVHRFGIRMRILYMEHLGHARSEHVGIQQADFVAQLGQPHSQVGRYRRFPHTAFAGRHGDNILHTGQQLPHLRTRSLQGFGVYLHFHLLAHVGMDGSLGSFHERLEERIRRLVENQRKTDMQPADTQIVFHHPRLYDVLSSTGITHGSQCVHNQFGIYFHKFGILVRSFI